MRGFWVWLADLALAPLLLLASTVMRAVRRLGVERLAACKSCLLWVGVFPIRRHYYEPLFHTEPLRSKLGSERELPGIDLNVPEQLALLAEFTYSKELLALPLDAVTPQTFHYHNTRFGPGDAELLYSMIRRFRPRRLIEIGSGMSTLGARLALD